MTTADERQANPSKRGQKHTISKTEIIERIQQIALQNNGTPPGKGAFTKVTGIPQGAWCGRYWARWTDALRDAGLPPNIAAAKKPSAEICAAIIVLIRDLGHFPTHYDILSICREAYAKASQTPTRGSRTQYAYVYLVRSAAHYKIGQSKHPYHRAFQLDLQRPEELVFIHAIRTDDPDGIEAYWHKRFADKRVKGEWFKLTPTDVRIFKRRTLMWVVKCAPLPSPISCPLSPAVRGLG